RIEHATGLFAARAWFHAAAADVSDAEGEESLCRHDTERIRSDFLSQKLAVTLHRESLWHFERRPQSVDRSQSLGVCRADDDMSRERILIHHISECRIDPVGWHSPGDERAGSEVGRHQGLPDAANHARLQHRSQALDYQIFREASRARNCRERLFYQTGDT